jgi:glyoxylase I family protein
MPDLPELVRFDPAKGRPVDRISVGIWSQDLNASLRFYGEGIGLQVLSENYFDVDLRKLFDLPADRLHSVFMGDPRRPDAGTVELLHVEAGPPSAPMALPSNGFVFLAFMLDVPAAVQRLSALGLAADLREVPAEVGHVATVRDPDGVRIELIDVEPAPATAV